MRIRRLDLTRFGHFTGRAIDFGEAKPGRSDFHLVYGPNEAGKTTLMEGFLRLVYGFPHREDYAFLHPQDTLQVGGLVETGGRSLELVRVKKRGASLLDAHGQPVPETVLQAALAGLSPEAYRNLLCLDDRSIEEGGEEILKSEGDVGALLFSAAAGVSGLSAVLADVQKSAEAFWRKNSGKNELSELKRRHQQIGDSIREQDVSANRYRQLRADLETQERGEARLRALRGEIQAAQRRFAALAEAHGRRAAIARLDAALEPLAHLPARIGVDPGKLDELATTEAGASARLAAAQRSIEGLEAELAKTSVSELLDLRKGMDALAELHGKVVSSESDLPRREAERAALQAAMGDMLADLGASGADAGRFHLPAHRIDALDDLAGSIQAAQAAANKAADEERAAARSLASAREAAAQAKAALAQMPDPEPVLEAHDAQALAERLVRLRGEAERAARTARDRLAELDPRPAELGAAVRIDPAEAEAHAGEWARALAERKAAMLREREANEALSLAQARAEAIAAGGDLPSAEAAQAARDRRDALWADHRRRLDEASADAFEEAMHGDDRVTATRLAAAARLAQQHEAQIALATAQAAARNAEAALAAAQARCGELEAAHAARLAALGLPPGIATEALAGWLERRNAARVAAREMAEARAAAKPAEEAAARLLAALAELPGIDPAEGVDAALRKANRMTAARRDAATAAAAKAEAEGREEAALARRREEREAAAAALAGLQAQAANEIANIFGSGETPPLGVAVRVLRRLREEGERLRDLDHRIEAMHEDSERFGRELAALLAGSPGFAGLPPLEAWRLLRDSVEEAGKAQAARERLEAELRRARREAAEAALALDAIARQVADFASLFAEGDRPEGLAELRRLVADCGEADALRSRIAEARAALLDGLAAAGVGEGEAALDAVSPAEAQAGLADASTRLDETQQALEAAIAERSRAGQELRRVQGDDDVALLTAERRAIEARMEEGAARWLQDRLGLMLAERALRRYRDEHRSAMLREAEAAFATLTAGAYVRLSTQPSGQAEELVAIGANGGAKRAKEMSKGTRFQLYLALRAAAYAQMAGQGTALPFFCDDIFETFDEERTTAACGLMRRIGEQGQAIYLTHHAHVVEIALANCPDAVTVHELKPGSLRPRLLSR